MSPHESTTCTAFDGHRLLASGPLDEVALAARQATHPRLASNLFMGDLSGVDGVCADGCGVEGIRRTAGRWRETAA